MVRWRSKFHPRVAYTRYATLKWHLPDSCSKLYPRVAHKRYAALEWHLPALNVTPAWLTKGMLPGHGTFLL